MHRFSSPAFAAHTMLWAGLVVAVVCSSAPARACAACACGDPTLTVMGTEKPSPGRLRIGFEQRFSSEGSRVSGGQGDGETDFTSTARSDQGASVLSAVAVVHARLVLSAEGSFAVRRARIASGRTFWTSGPSDVTLRARFIALTDRAYVPRHLFGFTAGARTPWPVPAKTNKDVAVPLDAQPSLGAHVFEGGAFYSGFFDGWLRPLSFFASARFFAATPGFENYLAGPGFLATATVQFQPIPAVAIVAGIDTRSTFDSITVDGNTNLFAVAVGASESAAVVAAPGGHVVMPHVGVVFSPMTDVLLRLLVRVPVFDSRAPTTWDGPQALVGVTWDL